MCVYFLCVERNLHTAATSAKEKEAAVCKYWVSPDFQIWMYQQQLWVANTTSLEYQSCWVEDLRSSSALFSIYLSTLQQVYAWIHTHQICLSVMFVQ